MSEKRKNRESTLAPEPPKKNWLWLAGCVMLTFANNIAIQKWGSQWPDWAVWSLYVIAAICLCVAAFRYEQFLNAGGKIKQQIKAAPLSFGLFCFLMLLLSWSLIDAFVHRPHSNVIQSGYLPPNPIASVASPPRKVEQQTPSQAGAKQPHIKIHQPQTQSVPAPAQPLTYEQKCESSACAPGPGSQATYNQLGSPLPKVTASAQRQMQTGKLDAPWETVFTISTNVLVQTGDLRLKCSGPVIMAGISRINPASLSTGSNGPNPADPDEVIYQLGPEMLSPGQIVTVAVYSKEPVNVLSGSIGPNTIVF